MSVQAVIMIVGAIALLVSTVTLVRNQMLSIRYGLGWLTVAVLGIIGTPLLNIAASQVRHIGLTPTGFSLGILIVFLGIMALQLSISLSGLHRAVQDLSEHAALLDARVQDLELTDAGEDVVIHEADLSA